LKERLFTVMVGVRSAQVATGGRGGVRGIGWGRTLAAVCLVAGPLAAVCFELIAPTTGSDSVEQQVQDVVANSGAMNVALAFDLLGLLLVPAVVFVAVVARAGAPRLAPMAGAVAFVGYLCLTVVVAGDALLVAAAKERDRTAAVSLVHGFWDTWLVKVMLIGYLAGHILGVVLLAVALWRSRAVARWAAVILLVLPLFEIAEQASGAHAFGAIGYALVAVTFGLCAARLIRERQELPLLDAVPT
jgi:hypothetical protein